MADNSFRVKVKLAESTTTDINNQLQQVQSKLKEVQLKIDSGATGKELKSLQTEQTQLLKNQLQIQKVLDETNAKMTESVKKQIQQKEDAAQKEAEILNKNSDLQYELQQKKIAQDKIDNQNKLAQINKEEEALRKLGQEYVKQSASKLQGVASKYSYADTTELNKLATEFNQGGSFQDLQSIPAKIQEYESKIATATNQAKISHQENLNAINQEIRAEQEMANAFEQTERNRRNEIEKTEQTQTNTINKNLEAQYKLNQAAKEEESIRLKNLNATASPSSTLKIYDQLTAYQKVSESVNKLQSLQQKFGTISGSKIFDPAQVSSVTIELERLGVNATRITNTGMFKQWSTDFNNVRANVNSMNNQFQQTEGRTISLGTAFKEAFSKFPKHKWGLVA